MSTIHYPKSLQRKRYLAGLLEIACQELELPALKWESAKTAYGSVGTWLNECSTLSQWDPLILPQGSAALGTTVKPTNSENFDIDLVCHLRKATDASCHITVKRLVGQRLKEYEKRGPKCSEYKRCWRLDYAVGSQMHLDITPAVNHTASGYRALAVPDRELKCWQESNPPDYVKLFTEVAALQPIITSELVEFSAKAARAEIRPLPDQTPIKGYLRRTVQLVKRHRSIHFEKQPDLAPISIILTTLAMRAYAKIVSERRAYNNEFDVVCDVVRLMPDFIRTPGQVGEWQIMNDTTKRENFAEKWNKPGSLLAASFYAWHRAASADFQALADAADRAASSIIFDRILGTRLGTTVRAKEESLIKEARQHQAIAITRNGTLNTYAGIMVPATTFFGV